TGNRVAEQFFTLSGKRGRTTRVVANREIDVVTILLLIAAVESISLHYQQCRNRRHQQFHLIAPSVWHCSFKLLLDVVFKRNIAAICALNPQAFDQFLPVPVPLRGTRHQQIDQYTYWLTIIHGDPSAQLKRLQIVDVALVSLPLERFDEVRVLTISQC